ncbi:unnamed protein product [Moneuplotes crassus]|uniref:Uncharacterized protein n=2 Tax=Euplotes crassus TaxID=5936 RepID=A0AAD1X7Z0_EUPCR|nr:unnamed protein product [Moneuplotes crassus]
MPGSLYSVSVTEEDRQRFPDLFKSKRQIAHKAKTEIGANIRNKLKSLKQSYIEEKIRKEKELIKERYQFEQLLEKYQKYRRPNDELPTPMLRYHDNMESRRSLIQEAPKDLNFFNSNIQEDEKSERGLTPSQKHAYSRNSIQNKKQVISLRKIKGASLSRLEKDFGTVSSGTLKSPHSSLIKKIEKQSLKRGTITSREKRLQQSDKSHSMANLLNAENKINIKERSPRVKGPKMPQPIFSSIQEEEDTDVEEKMKSLPHWKYAASFTNYVKEIQGIREDEKEEFLNLYNKKHYKKLYDFLCNHKNLKKYFDNFVMEAQEEDKSPDIKKKKREHTHADNFLLKQEKLERQRVQSRLFGHIQDDKDQKVDWKNLEKLSKDAICKSDLPLPKLKSLSKVLENEIVRLEKLIEKCKKELKRKPRKDLKEEDEKKKTSKRKEMASVRLKKLIIVKDECDRMIKLKEDELKKPGGGIIIDPKKQIYVSKVDANEIAPIVSKKGKQIQPTQGHIKNLRKKDYYENRVKKGFQQ